MAGVQFLPLVLPLLLFLALRTNPLDRQAVVGHGIAILFGNIALPLLDSLINKLVHPAALYAEYVVVMTPLIQLEYRMPALEVMPEHQSGRLKLGQYPIDRGKPDILAGLQQRLVDILGTEVARLGMLQNIEDFDPRQSGLEARFFQFLIHHFFIVLFAAPVTMRYHACITYMLGNPMRRILISLIIPFVVAACAHKIDIQQGNVITEEQLSLLQPGMTGNQVRQLMGTPLLTDPFHPDRWDYYYSMKSGTEKLMRYRATLFFSNDRLLRIERVGPIPEKDTPQLEKKR